MSKNDLGGRYICFSLETEKFAVPLLQVKEVIGNLQITPVPQTPPYFLGIMNLRGQIISVVDLKFKLNIKKTSDPKETTIIILDFQNLSMGVVVDSIDCVVTFANNDINQNFDEGSMVANHFISGVAKRESGLTLLLDLAAALGMKDLEVINQQALAAAA